MRKWYLIGFGLLIIVALVGLQHHMAVVDQVTGQQQAQQQALDVEHAVDEARQQAAQEAQMQQLIAQIDRVMADTLETNEQARALTDRINAKLDTAEQSSSPTPKPEPTPAAITGFAPNDRSPENVYTNDALKPDTRSGRVLIKFTPEQANGIEWKALRKRGCALYGFVQANGQPINYADCAFAVAR